VGSSACVVNKERRGRLCVELFSVLAAKTSNKVKDGLKKTKRIHQTSQYGGVQKKKKTCSDLRCSDRTIGSGDVTNGSRVENAKKAHKDKKRERDYTIMDQGESWDIFLTKVSGVRDRSGRHPKK